MSETLPLLAVIDAYIAAESVPDTTISYRVFKDTKKVAALRAGRDITTSRNAFALTWFSEHWPPQAVWPSWVARPFVESKVSAA